MRTLLPHLPKCAGTSLRWQLDGHPRVVLDYLNHPTWHDAGERARGRAAQQALKDRVRARPDSLIFGHFAVRDYADVDYGRILLFLRDPLERARSHFAHVRDTLVATPTACLRHPEVSAIKAGQMRFAAFAALPHIRHFYEGFYLRDLPTDREIRAFPFSEFEGLCALLSKDLGLFISSTVRANVGAPAPAIPEGTPEVADLFAQDRAFVAGLLDRYRG